MDPGLQHRKSALRHSATHWHSPYLGEWELVGPLAEGEWSTVLLARPRDCAADRPADYAIKVARIGDARQRQAEQLIVREAAVGRAVTHPHLVAVLTAQVETSPHYVVMPLLKGAILRRAVDACGSFAAPHALWIARQVGEALLALHSAGWMHADVKPANILVSSEGHATLIDLGFALRLNTDECAAGGSLRGTMAYTAPEMISAAVPVDGRSDIYSLGITLYELLTGKLPFPDEDPGRLVLAHLQRAAPNPRRVVPGLAPEVARLLRDMLAKEPLRRPAAEELVQRLVDLEIATFEDRQLRTEPVSGAS